MLHVQRVKRVERADTLFFPLIKHIRAVYTRENKPQLTLAAAYVSRERNYLYEYKLPGQGKPRLEKAVNVDFVPFIRGVRGLRKPRPELATAYFLSYKRPYCFVVFSFFSTSSVVPSTGRI